MMSHNLVWADLAAQEYQTRINRAERDGWKLNNHSEIELTTIGFVAPSLLSRALAAVDVVLGRKNKLEESKECCA